GAVLAAPVVTHGQAASDVGSQCSPAGPDGGRCDAACAAPNGPPPAIHRSSTSTGPSPAPTGPPVAFRRHRRPQRVPHRAPVHAEVSRQPVNRQALALAPLADLLEQSHLRPLGHHPRSAASSTPRWTRGGAKSDEADPLNQPEHYPPKWGQIR